MSIAVAGTGAVSAAGWGARPLMEAWGNRGVLTLSQLERAADAGGVITDVLRVPAESPPWLPKSPRLRRVSPISKFAAAAAAEALGAERMAAVAAGEWRVGVLCGLMNGCVNYSNRFFAEVLKDPATASPILFPETVFNAPSSHLSAIFGSTAPNDTLIGDGAGYFTALEIATEWIARGDVDGCLVIGCEEIDWLTAEALVMYEGIYLPAEGAGALYLEKGRGPVRLLEIPDVVAFNAVPNRQAALQAWRGSLTSRIEAEALLIDSRVGVDRFDAAEDAVWSDWRGDRWSPREWFGEALGASSALQCVMAVEALKAGTTAQVVVAALGGNAQAGGAVFGK